MKLVLYKDFYFIPPLDLLPNLLAYSPWELWIFLPQAGINEAMRMSIAKILNVKEWTLHIRKPINLCTTLLCLKHIYDSGIRLLVPNHGNPEQVWNRYKIWSYCQCFLFCYIYWTIWNKTFTWIQMQKKKVAHFVKVLWCK